MIIKKVIVVLFLIVTVILLFSLGASALQTKRLTEEEILEIKLYENPSTGHRWELKIENNDVISEFRDEYKRLASREGLVGRGGIHSWSFKAEKKGFSILTFKLTAPEEQKVVETRSYLIAVDLIVKEITADEIMEIKLAENPSTGYSWQLDLADNKNLQLLQQEYNSLSISSANDNQEKKNLQAENKELAGLGGIKSWTFRGLEKGYQFLIFKLARSGKKAIKIVDYLILVE